jgi:uncharacterized membrane protein
MGIVLLGILCIVFGVSLAWVPINPVLMGIFFVVVGILLLVDGSRPYWRNRV